jgi:hypothetical protein
VSARSAWSGTELGPGPTGTSCTEPPPPGVAADLRPGEHGLAGQHRHLAGPGQRRRAGRQDLQQPVVGPAAQHHALVGGQFGVAEQATFGHRVQRHPAVAEESGQPVHQQAEPEQGRFLAAVEVGEAHHFGHFDDPAGAQGVGGEAALNGVQGTVLVESHSNILRHAGKDLDGGGVGVTASVRFLGRPPNHWFVKGMGSTT